MPQYEYKCDCCRHEFEVEQKVTEDALQECPKCRVCALRRMISGCSFVLRGNCWAADLYTSAKKAGDE